MNALVNRRQVVDAMTADFSADVTEHVGHEWRRVSAMVAEQDSGSVSSDGFDFHMLEMYLEGTHRGKIDGELFAGDQWEGHFMPGCLSYMQDAAPFEIEFEGHGKVLHIYIDNSIIESCAEAMFKGNPETLVTRSFQGAFDPGLKSLASHLLEEARRPRLGSDLHADLTGQQIAVAILRLQHGDRLKSRPKAGLSQRQMARVLSYFEDQIEGFGGIDTLADLVDMDACSFAEAFKVTTGETPGDFLFHQRLIRVKELLRATNSSIANIARVTGFSGQGQLSSAFARHVGISPGKWREAVCT